MKDFKELSEPELLALTDDDIARYLDLEAAEQGVPLLPPPPVAPTKSADNTPDLTVYTIAGLTFTAKSEALDIRDAIFKTKTRVLLQYASGRYTYSGPMKAVPDDDEPTISDSKVFSEYDADKRAASLAAQNDADEEHRKAREAYDRIVTWRQTARQPIVDAINNARRFEARRLFLTNEHERYLQLAGNNRRIAARFLAHAHPDAEERLPAAFQFKPEDPPDPKPRAYHEPEGQEATETVF